MYKRFEIDCGEGGKGEPGFWSFMSTAYSEICISVITLLFFLFLFPVAEMCLAFRKVKESNCIRKSKTRKTNISLPPPISNNRIIKKDNGHNISNEKPTFHGAAVVDEDDLLEQVLG